MIITSNIKTKVQSAFTPLHVELVNESHMHAGPATESHFKLVLVSDVFTGLSAVKRHQAVYKVLQDELAGPVHALALHLYAPAEWNGPEAVPGSPPCAGKNT